MLLPPLASDAAIRDATPDDAPVLAALGQRTFVETFVDRFRIPYSKSDLEVYFAQNYSSAAVRSSFGVPRMKWWIAERGGVPVGFAKAGPCGLPHPEVAVGDGGDGELKNLYVLEAHHGVALGRTLLDACLGYLEATFVGPAARPRAQWLGVWSGNEKAQRLYERHGFARVGQYEYPVGRTLDLEFIYRRASR